MTDTLDYDRFLNLDQTGFPSPSTTPGPSKGKGLAVPEFRPPSSTNSIQQPPTTTSQAFAGPSHQYDLHKQQTSLPIGALANSLAAASRPTFAYGYGGFSQNYGTGSSAGFFDMETNDELFDFNSALGHTPSFSNSMDMDMDFDSPIDGFFNPNDSSQASSSGFVDPSALGGQEDDSPTPTPREIKRLWPGMHTQQAALAAKQQQEEAKRQQQQQPQKNTQMAGAASQQHKRNNSRANGSVNRPTDPVVEESISRLLSQMRQSSAMSSANGGDATPAPSSHHGSKQKRDEEDMDEDERLLASEEGKKLSSKERRQLRNKVSARAFRSRRKEYISQLEGELAAKGHECDELISENEALKTENTRLTGLTRMLLSSPAFSTFLNELPAASTTALQPQAQNQSQPPQQQQQQPSPKDVAPTPQQAQQLQQDTKLQVGMTSIPESSMDFSLMESVTAGPTNNSSWGVGMDFGFTAQVFAVGALPEGPSGPDAAALAGKPSDEVDSLLGLAPPVDVEAEAKEAMPTFESMPSSAEKAEEKAEEERDGSSADGIGAVPVDESDPAFALFVDAPVPSAARAAAPEESEFRLFGAVEPAKAFARLDLVVDGGREGAGDAAGEAEREDEDGGASAAAMARFEQLCAGLDAAAERIAAIVGRL